MRGTTWLTALAWGTVAGALASGSCARSVSEQRTTPLAPCQGTPVLTVHNNTTGVIEVYEYRAGARTMIATVRPGTETVAVSGEAGVSYGAQASGGTEVLAATSRPRAGDRVQLERGCR